MASWFHLELDTTPPAVTLDSASVDRHGRLLISYSLTEPRVAEAVIDGRSLDVEPGRLVARQAPRSGTVTLKLIDDVYNAATVELPYQVRGVVGRVAAGVMGLLSGGRSGRAARGKKGGISS